MYKIKTNSDGSIERYKTRLVVKRYSQQYGMDYEETFAPDAKMTTIHHSFETRPGQVIRSRVRWVDPGQPKKTKKKHITSYNATLT